MYEKSFFFAGGGTGGHIYPAVAVAEQIAKIKPEVKIHFFCSNRDIDKQILGQTDFEFTGLTAMGFSFRPRKLGGFCKSFLISYKTAKEVIAESENAVVVGTGGFVSAPVCMAAHKCKVPVGLINVDIVPGRANKIISRWADEIFIQFEETARYFERKRGNVTIVGCPLRSGFDNPQPDRVVEQLGLDKDKKTLLITGASSGSQSINRAVCSLLEKLNVFSDDWQIVHLTGVNNYENVNSEYCSAKISHIVLGYFDDMPSLLAAADLVIGRSGAVSVAEFAASETPSICMPYPYHKDRHQYLNAGKLVEAGAAVIVDDLQDEKDRSEWLWEELEELMRDDEKRQEMKSGCRAVAKTQAGLRIAEKLIEIGEQK
ncbi:MAG: UDP-N-acetylglucosamine--N-acetylmuramyl-(pentapeptide) pyrophosphoryl-undecaprenol N-acetylglucosamine transferase [Sedimentisphaerales bacterium]|nr:UDP-N-acetylglucosamine--N-acetylmuramyl-(pentapeptide) pyrophosphoryl-undecaprenol N-acetylglucosamine transferase [Sedimentisphaerales bacterium]